MYSLLKNLAEKPELLIGQHTCIYFKLYLITIVYFAISSAKNVKKLTDAHIVDIVC